jgi:hypothetical protein
MTGTPMSALRVSILQQISEALDEVFAEYPEQSSENDRQKAKSKHLSHAEHVLDACSTEELRSESALERYIATTVRNARLPFYNL